MGINFFRYEDTWVVPTKGRTPTGLALSIEPVLLVQADDADGLRRAILEQLQNQLAVPEPDANQTRKMVAATALGLKPRAFHAAARAFGVAASSDNLAVMELRRGKGLAFTSPVLWKREFGPDEFRELAWFLVKHDTVALPAQAKSASGSKRKKHREN